MRPDEALYLRTHARQVERLRERAHKRGGNFHAYTCWTNLRCGLAATSYYETETADHSRRLVLRLKSLTEDETTADLMQQSAEVFFRGDFKQSPSTTNSTCERTYFHEVPNDS